VRRAPIVIDYGPQRKAGLPLRSTGGGRATGIGCPAWDWSHPARETGRPV